MQTPSAADRLVDMGEEVMSAMRAGQWPDALNLMARLMFALSAHADELRVVRALERNGLASPRARRLLREFEQEMARDCAA